MSNGIAPFCSRAPRMRATASRNSDCRTGFIKYAATPNCSQRVESPRLPAEVSSMIIAVHNSGFRRICSMKSKPSIFGISKSLMINP